MAFVESCGQLAAMQKQELEDAVEKFVLEAGLPFNVVESGSLQELIKVAGKSGTASNATVRGRKKVGCQLLDRQVELVQEGINVNKHLKLMNGVCAIFVTSTTNGRCALCRGSPSPTTLAASKSGATSSLSACATR